MSDPASDSRPPFAEDPDELGVARRAFERFVDRGGPDGSKRVPRIAPEDEGRQQVATEPRRNKDARDDRS
jgi:hypothetical protein